MGTVQDWLKGYKTYLVLLAFAAFVLFTGQEPPGTPGAVLGFSPEAIEKAMLAAVMIAAKAAWNRYTESH